MSKNFVIVAILLVASSLFAPTAIKALAGHGCSHGSNNHLCIIEYGYPNTCVEIGSPPFICYPDEHSFSFFCNWVQYTCQTPSQTYYVELECGCYNDNVGG